MTVGVIAFILIILLSIMLHEAGHFLTAKAFKMKATEFFVGFGPRLWSFRRGETEYGVKAIPAGGYVRIVGMTDQERLDPADEPRAFYRHAAWKRLIVMSAGSAMHFIIAFLLFAGIYLLTEQQQPTTTIGSVSACVPDGDASECEPGDRDSPASQAGFQAGDRIISVDGAAIASWRDFVDKIEESGERDISVVVERAGDEVTLDARPLLIERADRPGETRLVGWLGVGSATELVKLGPLDAMSEAGGAILDGARFTVETLASIPAKIPDLWDATFNGGERSLDDPVGVVGIGRISGELVERGAVSEFLLSMAYLNVVVGVFNMLPLLPLDGGHVALLVIEKIRSFAYRLVGRRDPGRLDPAKLLPAAYLFLVLLVMLTVLLLAADIVNPVRLPS